MEIPYKATAIPNELLCDGRVLRTAMINPALVRLFVFSFTNRVTQEFGGIVGYTKEGVQLKG